MSKFLANENVPIEAVELARQRGLDMAWIKEIMPSAEDESVLALSLAEGRVLVTYDKDFGEMAFQQGQKATCGVILLRPRLRHADYLAQLMITVLTQQVTWEGNFSVAREGQLRVVPLPE
jgi:predicted nuclease of predicted toxin-antitoxin system